MYILDTPYEQNHSALMNRNDIFNSFPSSFVAYDLDVLEFQHEFVTRRPDCISVCLLDPFVIDNTGRVIRVDCGNDELDFCNPIP